MAEPEPPSSVLTSAQPTERKVTEPVQAAKLPRWTTLVKWLIPVGLAVVIRFLPTPSGLEPRAWHYFALFAGVIAALVTEPLPGAAVGLIGVSIAAAYIFVGKTPAEAVRWALSGFSNDTVWLIVAANIFAIGYEVTGLGRRIALLFVKSLGRKTLGLGYAIALSDLVLSPFMPSNTARSGGTIYPVVKNIPPLYGSTATNEPRKIGSYLMWTGFATTCVTSSMFVTALAPNLLALELVKKTAKVDVSWMAWMRGFLPVGLVLFLATPLLTYFLYPPAVKRGDEVMRWAKLELNVMGRISRNEIVLAVLAVVALVGWIGGARWVAPVTVAFIVISLMLLTGVVDWSQISGNKQAWTVLVWFATLVAMADGLNSVGFLKWFASIVTARLAHYSPLMIVIGAVALFFLIHYLFASLTAHTAAVLPVMLGALVLVPGVPVRPVALLMCYSLGIMGVITPYATGPAPIWYSSGYIPAKDFWRMGALTGLFYLIGLLAIGVPYVMAVAR